MMNSEEKKFKVQFKAVIRKYGLHISDDKHEIEVVGNDVEEWKDDLWAKTKTFLHHKIIFKKSVPNWAETKPSKEDMFDFIIINNQSLNDVNEGQLNKWNKKITLPLTIYIYSKFIKHKTHFETVQNILFQPLNEARREAEKHNRIAEIELELKEMHKYRYVTEDINYTIWASYIMLQIEKGEEEKELYKTPPLCLTYLIQRSSENYENSDQFSDEIPAGSSRSYVKTTNELIEQLMVIAVVKPDIVDMITSKLEACKTFTKQTKKKDTSFEASTSY